MKNITITEKPFKASQYVESQLLSAIVDGRFKPGTVLPGERNLSQMLGVTRPTLRETLQKMARDGWLSIRHGKPTLVNDYMKEGGMGILASLARFDAHLPLSFIENFLSVRCVILPSVSRMALEQNPAGLESFLMESVYLEDDSVAYTEYDWQLQLNMASFSENPFFRIILNDFDYLYKKMGRDYFASEEARAHSKKYYDDLLSLVIKKDCKGVELLVRKVMDGSLELWKALNSKE